MDLDMKFGSGKELGLTVKWWRTNNEYGNNHFDGNKIEIQA